MGLERPRGVGLPRLVPRRVAGSHGRGGGGDGNLLHFLGLRADAHALRAGGKPLDVLPGMLGTAEIRVGRRSVLSFLLRPMMKAQEAFSER